MVDTKILLYHDRGMLKFSPHINSILEGTEQFEGSRAPLDWPIVKTWGTPILLKYMSKSCAGVRNGNIWSCYQGGPLKTMTTHRLP